MPSHCLHPTRFPRKIRHSAPERSAPRTGSAYRFSARVPQSGRAARHHGLFAPLAALGLFRRTAQCKISADGSPAAPWREHARRGVCLPLAVPTQSDRVVLGSSASGGGDRGAGERVGRWRRGSDGRNADPRHQAVPALHRLSRGCERRLCRACHGAPVGGGLSARIV